MLRCYADRKASLLHAAKRTVISLCRDSSHDHSSYTTDSGLVTDRKSISSLVKKFHFLANKLQAASSSGALSQAIANDQETVERNGKAWVGFKKQGAKTVYSELTGKRDAAGNIVVKSQDGFSVNQFNLSHITISYHDLNDGNIYEARFQAPSQTFPSIHASKKRVLCIDASNGGLGVSSENDGKVFVWTTENGEIRRILTGHVGDVCVCRFFPSGLVILSGAADCRVKIWSAESGDCAATFIGHTAGISDLAIVERGRNVVSVSRDRSVRLWDCGKSACLANFSPDETVINGCCIGAPTSEVDLTSPNTVADDREVLTAGKLLLLACENNSLFAFELGSRKQIFKSVFESAVNCCAFSTDTTVLCGTEDSFVHMLDLRYTRRCGACSTTFINGVMQRPPRSLLKWVTITGKLQPLISRMRCKGAGLTC